MDLQSLKDRRAQYVAAETAVLKRQSYSIDVEGGSRSVTFADLGEIRQAIKDLDIQISQGEGTTLRRRRVFYIRSR
jgi:hypothetical protein